MIKSCHTIDEFGYIKGVIQAMDITGDVAEVGVWNGGTAECIKQEMPKGEFHLFDTFEGIPKKYEEENWPGGIYAAHLPYVQEALGEGFIYHRGDVVETKTEIANKKFAFVHFDIDVYVPLKDALPYFYERLLPKGIMLISNCDIAHPGVLRAVKEVFGEAKGYSRYKLIKKQ